jgi:hypothetical protein
MSKADFIEMGGTANVRAMTDRNGIGVMTGTINGAAYGEIVSEVRDLGGGKTEFNGIHHFLDRDGSSLYTSDVNTVYVDPNGRGNVMEVVYNVVRATGRFAGYGGSFTGTGLILCGSDVFNDTAVGLVRFSGRLHRL